MNVTLGMSGGVDSSASAILLKNMGFSVSGLTLKLFGDEDKDAKKVCEKIGISHRVLDLSELFRNTVIENFITEYLKGRTPNPCIVCNEKIKFGAMLLDVLDNGGEMIATGHYAKIVKSGERFLINKPTDLSKDQTYVLYGLTQHQLSHTIFPLGELSKTEARELALESGLINARKKDSQDICFVPDGDYAKFIEETLGIKSASGDFTDIQGNILGKHNGLIHYTIGQRKGLGIALGKPAFVISKDVKTNRVVLGDEEGLFCKFVKLSGTNYIPFDKLESDIKVKAKLRYRHTEQPAVIHPTSETTAVIEFSSPQRAPALGQSAVFYDGDTVVGGGIIEEGF